MNALNFEIERIFAGWFDVKFITKDKQVVISASDTWLNDSPLYFLRMIIKLLKNNITEGYVVFDEEPGTYFVSLETLGKSRLSILYSPLDDNELKNIELNGILSRNKIEEAISDTEELFEIEDFSIEAFSRAVLRSFEEWSSDVKIREYEGNWMEFPKTELLELKALLYPNRE